MSHGSTALDAVRRWWPEMRLNTGISGDRLLAIAFAFMATVALVGVGSGKTAASFTGTTVNPANNVATMLVQVPAAQNNPTSAAAGAVALSWTATPTAPGAGHTLTYDVLRGPVGGPYNLIGNTAALTYSDTPPSDGTYEYVIKAKVTGGGTFTSGNSAAKSGLSDRTAPAISISCNGTPTCPASWYTATVSVVVSGVDGGTGMGSVNRNVDGAGQISTAGASVTFNVAGDSAGHSVVYFGTDAAGNAASSASKTIRIDGTAPTAPTGLGSASTAGNPSNIDVTWTAGTDALSGVAGYTVYWVQATTCPAATPANYPSSMNAGNVTSYNIAPLTKNAMYCAYVVTTDNAGNSSAASAVTGPTKAK
jgi:hypothetical protein